MKDKIIIKGAKVHNLKNVDLEIPRDKFIIFTGLSGSGKSSLAFDTIYAEGQRRYMESLSSYARQFLGQMDKPDVEYIEGLSPAISIDQKSTNKNPRSTVGTVTEIYDYMRLLYSKIGKPHCPKCGKEIAQQTVDQMVDKILEMEEKTKIQVLAPVIRGKKGENVKVLENIKKSGFVRVRIDGKTYDLQEEEIKLAKTTKHTIEAVVDRLVIKPEIRSRLAESIEVALKLAEGIVIINVIGGEDVMFSENFACADCGISIGELSPRMFSFNSPFGKCDTCEGLGMLLEIDPDLVIPDKTKSILEGAVAPWGSGMLREDSWTHSILKALEKEYKFRIDTPVEKLDPQVVDILLYGIKGDKIKVKYTRDNGTMEFNHAFEGVINNLKRRYRETSSNYMKNEIEGYMTESPCPECNGDRLRPEVLAVTVGGLNIAEVCKLSVKDEHGFFSSLELSEKDRKISEQILKEIKNRLSFLMNVGLDYINLWRNSGTLSGGEAQRIRLATQIGSSLMGVLYILDEPSIGLHQRDNNRLIETLKKLRDIGNTLIVVEHDEDTMREADFIVDIGPGAGEHGGEIVAAGSLEDIMNCERSITGQYLSGKKTIGVPAVRREPTDKFITVAEAAENNLKGIDVKFPIGLFTCVTGVSGSGKSTLVNEILYKGLNKAVNKSRDIPGW
ncbi:MAG TPA: excinuclease ABC subunit UvrA, partial [Clostridiaceae bacterium]